MVLMVNMRRFKQIVILLFFALGGQMAFAQLSVSQANALAMVDYLVDEENGTVEFNPATISFSGGANMLGQFNGSSSNIGFQEGVLMSTGLISNAVGPNDDDGLNGGGNFELSGTNLLAPLIGGKETYDAAVLRFQFRILGDYVKFRYVFASEEYNEFVRLLQQYPTVKKKSQRMINAWRRYKTFSNVDGELLHWKLEKKCRKKGVVTFRSLD
jgi:hypothetical protein